MCAISFAVPASERHTPLRFACCCRKADVFPNVILRCIANEQIVGVLAALYYIGKAVSLLTLLYLTVLGSLTLPKLYRTYQHTIDSHVDDAKKKVQDVYKKAMSKLSHQTTQVRSLSRIVMHNDFQQ